MSNIAYIGDILSTDNIIITNDDPILEDSNSLISNSETKVLIDHIKKPKQEIN